MGVALAAVFETVPVWDELVEPETAVTNVLSPESEEFPEESVTVML